MILFIFPVIALIAGFLSADTANAIDPIDPPQRLWPVIRWRVIAVAALVVLIEGMVTLSSIVNEFPLNQPISFDPPGSVDTRIWIPLREQYFLELWFSPQGHSFEQLDQLIGDRMHPTTDGVPVAISWTLSSSKTKAVVVQGAVVTKGESGFGSFSRIVDTIRVEPGHYQIHAMILTPVPQLAPIPARLTLIRNIKATETWQGSALFGGVIIAVWLLGSTVIFLLAWLICRIGVHYFRSLKNRSLASKCN